MKKQITQLSKTSKWSVAALTIFASIAVDLAKAQTPAFGLFGVQSDTVTALYANSTNLYIGAKTPVSANRLQVYDGSNLTNTGYTLAGTEITGIGRVASDSIVVFDKNGAVTTMSRYNGSNWTNNFNQYTGQVFAVGNNGGSSGQGTIYTVSSSGLYARVYNSSGASTPWSNTLGIMQTYDFAYHNGKMYACGFGTNANMRIYETNGTSWISSNITIPTGWYTVHEIESYGGYLYFVVRNTAGTSDELFRWNSAMGAIPQQLGITGQFNGLEVHDGKLYVAGDDLRSFDGTTWSTLTTLSSGQIQVLESYGTKLALGGSFEDLDGNTLLDHLAYLEYITAPTAQFSLSVNEMCEGESLTVSNTSTGTVDSYSWDIQGGSPSSSTLSDPGSIQFSTPGSYTITLTVSNVDGSDTHTETVVVHAKPVPVITPNGPTSFCEGDSIVLDAGIGFINYIWSNTDVGQTTTASASGSYSVTVTDNNNCLGTSANTMIVEYPLPNPSITLSGQELMTGSYSSYQWYYNGSVINGATSQTYTPLSNGNYAVEVTSADGCNATSANFNVNYLLVNGEELTQLIHISNGQLTTSLDWTLFDATGRVISSGKPGTFELPAGIFFIVTEQGNLRFYNP